jgi:hypothetical protein
MIGLNLLCCNGCSNRCPLSAPYCSSGLAKAEDLNAIAAELAQLRAQAAEEK